MSSINPRLLVKSLHDVRAKILFAFLFAGHAMDVEELMTWTGSPRNGHYSHLTALCGDGLLAKGPRMAHGRDVYLLGSEMLPTLQAWVAQLGEGKYLEDTMELLPAQVSGKQTPGAGLIIEAVAREPEEQAALIKTFESYRIIGKKKDELLRLEWVNAPYVRAHVEYAKAEEQWDDRYVGMAITRMIGRVAQPSFRTNGHIENCRCTTCKVNDAFGRSSYICDVCHQHPCRCNDDETEE